jgi:hypothetical protein
MRRMRKHFCFWKIGALVTIILCLLNCGGNKHKDLKPKRNEAEVHGRINELAIKYNAIADWEKDLDELSRPVYTMDLQKRFISNAVLPILFRAYLSDIKMSNGQYMATFRKSLYGGLVLYDYLIILDCSEEQVRNILGQHISIGDMFNDNAIIALITAVDKPVLKLSASRAEDGDGWIQVEGSDVFIFHGKLLDYLSIKDN